MTRFLLRTCPAAIIPVVIVLTIPHVNISWPPKKNIFPNVSSFRLYLGLDFVLVYHILFLPNFLVWNDWGRGEPSKVLLCTCSNTVSVSMYFQLNLNVTWTEKSIKKYLLCSPRDQKIVTLVKILALLPKAFFQCDRE